METVDRVQLHQDAGLADQLVQLLKGVEGVSRIAKEAVNIANYVDSQRIVLADLQDKVKREQAAFDETVRRHTETLDTHKTKITKTMAQIEADRIEKEKALEAQVAAKTNEIKDVHKNLDAAKAEHDVTMARLKDEEDHAIARIEKLRKIHDALKESLSGAVKED